MLALTTMTRLGLIVRLLVGAFVNTLIVLVLLASAVVVLLWIVGRNKQLRAKRQQRLSGADASPFGDGRASRLATDPPTPFGSAVSPVQDVPPRRLSFSAGQGGPGLGLRSAPGSSPHVAPASAPPLHSTPTVGPRGVSVANASDAGARVTPASSRRVSFLLTPEQERRVSTGGSLCDSGSASDTVPSSPRVVVTRLAGQPAGASTVAKTPADGAGAAPSGPGPTAEYESMDTGAASPTPRSSLKGSKSGQSPRRASFGGEITRRPIRKTSSAAVLSSSAATAAFGGAGPLPRRQLDPRLFKSVSMEWTPQNGARTTKRTLVPRGSSGAAGSGASGEFVDRGVLFEDSTDGRGGNDSADAGSADLGDLGSADSGDDSDGVDQSVCPSSGFSPGRRVAGVNALAAGSLNVPATGSSNAPPSRPAAGSSRQRRVMGGSIQKLNSSSAAIAAVVAARRARLLRGSPPGTMPVPLPRSLSSTGTNPEPAGAASPSTAAWERNRRAAAARVSRMLADADAAETAAAAVASQSRAHSRAAVAAEAAAASVRAQAIADETEQSAQKSGSLAPTKQTAPAVPSAARWELEQQISSLGSRPVASSALFQPLDQLQQSQRTARSAGQAQPSANPPQGKRRARDGGFSGADVPQVGPSSVGRGSSARGFEAGGPSLQSVGGPHVPPSFSMGAPVSSRPPTFDPVTYSAGGAAVEPHQAPLPTRSSGAPSFAPTTTLLAAPNGSAPANGPESSFWRPTSSQPTSQPPSVSLGDPTPRSGAGSDSGVFGGTGSFAAPEGMSPGNGPAHQTGDRPGGGSFGSNGFGGGLGFDGGSLGGAPSLNPLGALSSGGAGASTPVSTSGVSGGLKRSSSQLALEGSGGSGGVPRAEAATPGFGSGGSPFGGGGPPASTGDQSGRGALAAGAPRSFFAPPPLGTSGGFEAATAARPGGPPAAGPALFAPPTGGGGRGTGPALGAAPAPFSFGLPSPRLL